MKLKNEHLDLLRKISKDPSKSLRDLAQELDLSVGKVNYCKNALKGKGLIKINNFKKNPNKINYLYIFTPRGIVEKTKLSISFMKRKMKKYDELKKELEKDRKQNVDSF